jgi:hypothetical protein
MRRIVASLALAVVAFTVTASPAQAAPTEVNVRIEGREETLFEGPVLVESHRVKASSDQQFRSCNGINPLDPWNAVPAPVPTSAAADAMRILGLGFDGQWYGGYEDYFLTRWGPDAQDPALGAYWGIVVNNVFTNVGGCQYQLDGGDEVLWAYDAFQGAERLSLYPAGYSGGAAPLTATATKDVPFEVEVGTWPDSGEGVPPAAPARSTTPFQGAEVAPVITAANGFERVNAASPQTVATGADGKAGITFSAPGWHRIKATTVGAGGAETAIRSNRLDVCVPEPPASGCGALPAEDLARKPPPPLPGEEEVAPEEAKADAAPAQTRTQAQPSQGPVQVALHGLDRSQIAKGIVGVSWTVRDSGAGVQRWTISSRALGRKGARYVTRATGRDKTSARIRLPRGGRYALRIAFLDGQGRSSTAVLGKVRVPS